MRNETQLVRWIGGIAGPLFLTVVLLQAWLIPEFELQNHPLSLLALSDIGFIQTLNFIVIGFAFTIVVPVLKRASLDITPWTKRMIFVFGISLIVAGLFTADSWNGFPSGASEVITWQGGVHNAAAAIGGLSLVVAAVLTALHYARSNQVMKRNLAILVAITSLGLGILGGAMMDFRITLISGAIAWLWVSYEISTAQATRTEPSI